MKLKITKDNLKIMGFKDIYKNSYGDWVIYRHWWPAGRPAKDRTEYDKVYSEIPAIENNAGYLLFNWFYNGQHYTVSAARLLIIWAGYELSETEKVGHKIGDSLDLSKLWVAKDLKEIRKYNKELK